MIKNAHLAGLKGMNVIFASDEAERREFPDRRGVHNRNHDEARIVVANHCKPSGDVDTVDHRDNRNDGTALPLRGH
ncbi:protein of unknown function [Methylorubrum extorquens]|uniref:Uncharacterized protein n=1 Tax=Methylorubrum extorquens TaxID=408 RepID=A0A2N9AH33_METEX|nr:protein of unknown function [Methylorubrum extorquens]